MINILGMEMNSTVFAAIVALISSFGTAILTHFLGSRKQYKDILKRLGKFEKITLEAMIGDTGVAGNLTAQHSSISKTFSDKTQDLSEKLKHISETAQSIDKRTLAEKIIREDREKHLTPKQVDTKEMLDYLSEVNVKWMQSFAEVATLKEQIVLLNAQLRELTAQNEVLKRNSRNCKFSVNLKTSKEHESEHEM